MDGLRRLARRSLGDLRERPLVVVHGGLVLFAAWLFPLAATLAYVWAAPFAGRPLVVGFVLVQVLALVPVVLADLVVVRELNTPETAARDCCRAVGQRRRATVPWAAVATVGLLPVLANPYTGGAFGVMGALTSPVLLLVPSALVLLLAVPYALTLAVPVVVVGGRDGMEGGLRAGVRAQWRLLRRAPVTTFGVAVLGALPVAVAELLVLVGATLMLIGVAFAWLVVPVVLVVLGLPVLLAGLVALPITYAYARALAVRTSVTGVDADEGRHKESSA